MEEQIPDLLNFLPNISESPMRTTLMFHVKPSPARLTTQEFPPLWPQFSAKSFLMPVPNAVAVLQRPQRELLLLVPMKGTEVTTCSQDTAARELKPGTEGIVI